MNVRIQSLSYKKADVDVLVACYFNPLSSVNGPLKELDAALGGKIQFLKQSGTLPKKLGDITVIHSMGDLKAHYLLLVCLGDEKKLTTEAYRRAAGNVSRKASSLDCESLGWICPSDFKTILPLPFSQAIVEGLVLGNYSFDAFRSKKETTKTLLETLTFYTSSSSKTVSTALNDGAHQGSVVGESVNIARDLANTPCNHLTPKDVVEFAKKELKSPSVKIEIIDQKQAAKLGMGAFLGVAQGSVEPPFMLVIRYNGASSKQKPIALVGKGVTFDSGGISIKPAAKMNEMKGDMSGAAAVLGTLNALIKLKPKLNVIAVIPLTENMPSGSAQRPGDVVKAMNGKTIEIINTDAEGRLILADALCYAVKQKPSVIIDIATLTGACSVALGDCASAVLGNHQPLVNELLKGSQVTGERLWQLPLYEDYFELMRSEVADMANASEQRLAGTAVGAIFLEQFVDKVHWAHLDIASMMHFSKTSGYTVKGMSGVGVRNLLHFVLNY